MSWLTVLTLGSTLCVSLLSVAGADDKPATTRAAAQQAAEPYDGFEADQALLRKHLIHKAKRGGKDTKASSVEAYQAALRILSLLSFLFRTREEVFELLGDPATVSDYNQPAGKDPASPLVYVFDTGYGGWKYTISFDKQGKVNQVPADGLD